MTTATQVQKLEVQIGELIAEHKRARDINEFAKYADDPAGFLRDVLRCDPWEKQVEMAELVRDYPRVCLVSGNAVGKDWLVARLALWWVYARRGFVILTSVTDRQARNISMKEVRKAFVRAPELPGELFQMELRVNDSTGMLAFTSDNTEKLVGFHHPRLLLALSEAQGLEPDTFEAAFACATGPENRIVVYGNPTRPVGNFHTAATSDNWKTLVVPTSAHPNIVHQREEIPGGPSSAWIASMAGEYGENSSIYRARVLAEWPEESVEGLIKRVWLRAAFDKHDSGELNVANQWKRVTLSCDPARFGNDSTVLAVVRGHVVVELIAWHGASLTETADRVIEHAYRYWPDQQRQAAPRIVVDEPGVGSGCIDILRKKGWNVTAFNGAAKASDPKRHLNMRAAAHWRFRGLLENGQIALPRDTMLEEEALGVEWQLATSGAIQIVSKDTLRASLGRSPDRLDAVVMGLGYAVGGLLRGMSWGTFEIGG
ncbi:MAG TPA: hypothetical protein VHE78_04680 [Gemmatimonadaceae bacterium]|nr:hypothetical protein [Gemmatimonadaceae bacterium]